MTRTQAEAIIDELRQIRKLLERLPSGPGVGAGASAPSHERERVTVNLGTLPALGRNDAPLTIVEFTDYECPFCQRFHMTTFNDLKREYIDTGKVRYISRDLPLPMHPNAMQAAHAARCAGEQNKFWEMRHALIVNADQLGHGRYSELANELKLDPVIFQTCLDNPAKYKAEIEMDMSNADQAGIDGTPGFEPPSYGAQAR
jgi:protein-disulfide isomerase